jgi:DNA-binding MarR family transcriptional regulator
MDKETKSKMIESFALLFLLSHRFEYVADSELRRDDLTTKQFLALVAIEKAYDHPPSIKEVADVLSTTHQNVKQIAVQLQKKGFVTIEKDAQDKRKLILQVTHKNREYWDSAAQRHEQIISALFGCLNDGEIGQFHELVSKLIVNTSSVYQKAGP